MKGRKRCRMHGGTNPGAPEGNRNAWKHGARSGEAMDMNNRIRRLAFLVSSNSLE
ncbi:hypothetical protein [Sphingomonas sp. 35-24ZXX]|uniref:hypothetical protein n=1 Tax=Sphingomonas sp. 35-24ZXX TaxID=1545915 RepID=UPI003FA6E2AD